MARAFADSRGRYGYRRVKAALGTGVSEKVIRRIMREDGLVARVPGRRRYSSYEGEVTPAPDNLVNRDFTAERPNEKWLTDTTRDQGQRRKGVPFPDDRLLRRHGRGAHGRDVAERGTGATRCRVRAAATLHPGERPVVHSDRGCHYRWPGWLVVPEVLRKCGRPVVGRGLSALTAWCHRAGTCPGSGAWTIGWR